MHGAQETLRNGYWITGEINEWIKTKNHGTQKISDWGLWRKKYSRIIFMIIKNSTLKNIQNQRKSKYHKIDTFTEFRFLMIQTPRKVVKGFAECRMITSHHQTGWLSLETPCQSPSPGPFSIFHPWDLQAPSWFLPSESFLLKYCGIFKDQHQCSGSLFLA